jgi:hypothetical protein
MTEPKCIVCGVRLDPWCQHFTANQDGPLCGACAMIYGIDPNPAAGEGVDIGQDLLPKQ